jgi:hypothetical protein
MTATSPIEVRAAQLDVHEVPLASSLVTLSGAVAIRVAIPIGPRRLAGDIVRREAVGVCREHRPNFSARCGFEILLGDKRDQLVTFIAPGSG